MKNESQNIKDINEKCPIRDVIDRIGDKWSLLVIVTLAEKPTRFNELKRKIGDISQKVLSNVLKELEKDGYIIRSVFDETPQKVVYQLTDMGFSILKPIEELIKWAELNHQNIIENRQKYNNQRRFKNETQR